MSFSPATRQGLAHALGSHGASDEILNAIRPSDIESEALEALTNDTGGTADGTLSAVGDTSATNQGATINNNFTELFTQLDAIRDLLVANGFITE